MTYNFVTFFLFMIWLMFMTFMKIEFLFLQALTICPHGKSHSPFNWDEITDKFLALPMVRFPSFKAETMLIVDS